MELIKTVFLALSRILFFIGVYCLLVIFTFSLCFLIIYCICEVAGITEFLYEVLNFMVLHKTFTIVLFIILFILGFIYFINSFVNIYVRYNPDVINQIRDKE